jgi:hypothetical protein
MQNNSIYSESYKPLYIQEMDETSINSFAKVLSKKLRNVKLAITKSNVNNNKYTKLEDFEDPKKKKNLEDNKKNKIIKHLNPLNVKKKMMDHSKLYQTARDISSLNPFKVFEMRENEFKDHITDLNKPFALLSNKIGLMRKTTQVMSKTTSNFNEKKPKDNN